MLLVAELADQKHRASLRRRHYLQRVHVGLTQHSTWRIILSHSNDAGLLDVTGLTRAAFTRLHSVFRPLWLIEHPRERRSQRQLRSEDVVGLVLHWVQSTMRCKTLCQVFHTPPATVSRLLRRGMRVLRSSLQSMADAAIRWPSATEMEAFAAAVTAYEPGLTNIFGFVDGVYFQCTNPPDLDSQNAYYNGWRSMTSITNVLVFTPDGCIAWASFNCPGSWHDADVSRSLYDILLSDRTPGAFALAADTAFPRNDEMRAKIITPMKIDEELSEDSAVATQQLLTHRQVVRVRQAAEWGMHTLQAAFPRLKCTILWDPPNNHNFLSVVLHLFNYRTRTVGLNQTRSVYWQ